MDYISSKLSWALDIHDAGIISPAEAWTMKEAASEWLLDIYTNREFIIADYCNSIGIDPQLLFDIETIPVDDPNYKPSHNCLK